MDSYRRRKLAAVTESRVATVHPFSFHQALAFFCVPACAIRFSYLKDRETVSLKISGTQRGAWCRVLYSWSELEKLSSVYWGQGWLIHATGATIFNILWDYSEDRRSVTKVIVEQTSHLFSAHRKTYRNPAGFSPWLWKHRSTAPGMKLRSVSHFLCSYSMCTYWFLLLTFLEQLDVRTDCRRNPHFCLTRKCWAIWTAAYCLLCESCVSCCVRSAASAWANMQHCHNTTNTCCCLSYSLSVITWTVQMNLDSFSYRTHT